MKKEQFNDGYKPNGLNTKDNLDNVCTVGGTEQHTGYISITGGGGVISI